MTPFEQDAKYLQMLVDLHRRVADQRARVESAAISASQRQVICAEFALEYKDAARLLADERRMVQRALAVYRRERRALAKAEAALAKVQAQAQAQETP